MLLCLKLVWQLVNFLVSGCCNVVQLQATIVQIVPVLKGKWKIQCKLPPKTKRFCPLVLK